MNKEDQSIKKQKNHQDFITYTPQTIKYLTKKQEEVADRHILIINNLRKQDMTVKEIYNLYSENKRKKAIKTIYRYLEKLEEEGIVSVAGHRMTEGSRVVEKLYSRTAKVFIRQSAFERMNTEIIDEYIDIIAKFILLNFELKNNDISKLKQVLSNFFNYLYENTADMFKIIEKDEKIANYVAKTDITRVNYILDFSSIINTILLHSEIIAQLKDLIG